MTNDLNINDELDETVDETVDEVSESAEPRKRGRKKAEPVNTPSKSPVVTFRSAVAVTVKRDFWDADGNRHRKGTVVELSGGDLLDALETGSVSRVKD